jgi:hypothetical protein
MKTTKWSTGSLETLDAFAISLENKNKINRTLRTETPFGRVDEDGQVLWSDAVPLIERHGGKRQRGVELDLAFDCEVVQDGE